MAEEIDGLAITNIDGGLNANGLFINGNPVVAQAAGNVVFVSDLTDLPVPVGFEIFLADNTLYNFNALVDLEGNIIKYGVNSSILGIDRTISGVSTTSLLPMLDCNGNDLTSTNMLLNSSAPVSCGNGSVVLERCDFINFVTGAEVTNVQAIFVNQCTFEGGDKALDVNGVSNGSITLSLNLFRAQEIACVDISGALMNGFTANVNGFVTGLAGAFGILGDAADSNGVAANVSVRGFVLGCTFNGPGDSLGNITKKDVLWDFQSNSGVNNSQIIGGMDQAANITNTVLITSSFVQLAGTFVATEDIERFQVSSNQLVAQVTGEAIATFMCDAQKIGGGMTNDLQFALFKNGIQAGNIIRRLELDIDFVSVSFQNDVSFVPSDVFDVRVQRDSGNDDLQVNNATLFMR